MKKYWKKVLSALRDDEFVGIEYLITHLIFAVWVLIVLIIIGIVLG